MQGLDSGNLARVGDNFGRPDLRTARGAESVAAEQIASGSGCLPADRKQAEDLASSNTDAGLARRFFVLRAPQAGGASPR